MTQEEVKAQLAKHPLKWEQTELDQDPIAEVGVMEDDVYIAYIISDGDLLIKADDGGPSNIEVYLGCETQNTEKLKQIAEEHRIDFICKLLHIY